MLRQLSGVQLQKLQPKASLLNSNNVQFKQYGFISHLKAVSQIFALNHCGYLFFHSVFSVQTGGKHFHLICTKGRNISVADNNNSSKRYWEASDSYDTNCPYYDLIAKDDRSFEIRSQLFSIDS